MSSIQEASHVRYKLPTGTRWVEHQAAAIDSYLKTLPVMIGDFKLHTTPL